MKPVDFETRRATPLDDDAIAAAHRDSILSIGLLFYSQEVVKDWGAGLSSDLYLKAMERGEVFFIAADQVDGKPKVRFRVTSRRRDSGVHAESSDDRMKRC